MAIVKSRWSASYLNPEETNPPERLPWRAFLPGAAGPATGAFLLVHGLSPFSWVVRAALAERVHVEAGGTYCIVRGVPAEHTYVQLSDMYNPVTSKICPARRSPAVILSYSLGGYELLNVGVTDFWDEIPLRSWVDRVSSYRSERTDYLVFGFLLRDALNLGALVYKDQQAEIDGAFMLALPAGTQLRARILKRHQAGG
ncbi:MULTISPECIES: hypothetical protein [unclassified Chelatococcus]|uniref:hypothetical protein n=1 Tax=unclassified Chelatococcus TaxID=2638111 RepID=UPI001BD10011|nr:MULTISPECIES: hypothetical protein [unclassified Chelatococcus]MBS7699098.1 hypothetical protein [Chelatococcus sp. YT9]MBX3554879.1 hypothetical protein [Chelatococcus sp.]